jgi:hypothetical protein
VVQVSDEVNRFATDLLEYAYTQVVPVGQLRARQPWAEREAVWFGRREA